MLIGCSVRLVVSLVQRSCAGDVGESRSGPIKGVARLLVFGVFVRSSSGIASLNLILDSL